MDPVNEKKPFQPGEMAFYETTNHRVGCGKILTIENDAAVLQVAYKGTTYRINKLLHMLFRTEVECNDAIDRRHTQQEGEPFRPEEWVYYITEPAARNVPKVANGKILYSEDGWVQITHPGARYNVSDVKRPVEQTYRTKQEAEEVLRKMDAEQMSSHQFAVGDIVWYLEHRESGHPVYRGAVIAVELDESYPKRSQGYAIPLDRGQLTVVSRKLLGFYKTEEEALAAQEKARAEDEQKNRKNM